MVHQLVNLGSSLRYVYVDESGSDEVVERGGARGKARLFVVFAAVLDANGVAGLEQAYRDLLDREFEVVKGRSFRISELFDLYKRVTGREPEIKAGYLNNRDGPFLLFRDIPKALKDRYEAFRKEVFEYMLSQLSRFSELMIAVVVDKAGLRRLSDKIGRYLDPRLLAMDYLFTRVAQHLERVRCEAVVIHDETGRAEEIAGLLSELKARGYFYNPRLRHRPNYGLIRSVEFVNSATCIPIQFVDLAANVVLNTRAGASKDFYSVIANTSRYIEVRAPGGKKEV